MGSDGRKATTNMIAKIKTEKRGEKGREGRSKVTTAENSLEEEREMKRRQIKSQYQKPEGKKGEDEGRETQQNNHKSRDHKEQEKGMEEKETIKKKHTHSRRRS